MSHEEEEEVRSLLSRHQERIISDLQGTDLLAILVKNSVLTTSEEEILKSYPAPSRGLSRAGSERSASSVYGEDGENSSPTPSAGGGSISARGSVGGECRNSCGVTENPMINDADVQRWQCANLIEIIAKSGFERFKQFCYAIENECPQLIEDLINDRLKCDTTTIVSSSSNEEKIKKELDSDYIEKDKDIDRSRRAVSYSGSTTNSLPRAAPRRISLMKEPPPPPPPKPSLSHTSSINSSITAPSPIPSKFPQTEYNLIQRLDSTSNLSVTQQNVYQAPSTISSNYSSLLCHARSTTSPNAVRKREKLLHRFSDAATLGRKLKKKKNTNRTCHSMTEAIEMLADPVIEDEFFCSSRRRSFKAKTSSFNSQGSRRHSAIGSRVIRPGVGNPYVPTLVRHNGTIGALYHPFDDRIYTSKMFIRDSYMYPRQPGQSMDPRFPYEVHEFPLANPTNKVHIAGDYIPNGSVSSHRRRRSEAASIAAATAAAAAASASTANSPPNQVYWMQADGCGGGGGKEGGIGNGGSLKPHSRSNSLGYIRNVDDLLRNEIQTSASGSRHGTPHSSHRRKKRGDRTTWEYHTVAVTRVPGYGFGIAVSGGRDNPHFANGDPSIAVSDVLKGGPAEDRLQVNDRIISVNGVSLENVEYATAVQVLRDSGNTVTLVVKRRVPISSTTAHQHSHSMSSVGLVQQPITAPGLSAATASPILNAPGPGQPIKVTLTKSSKKEDYGVVLGCRLFIKEISSKARDQLAANGYSLQEGDILSRIHNTNCGDTMSLKEAKKIIDGCKERLNLVVLRDITNQGVATNVNSNHLNNSTTQSSLYSHTQQVSNCSNNLDDPYLGGGASYSSQNLYVQPPTRSSNGPVGLVDEKSNLTPRGRSRGPLMDVSLSQLDRPSTPPNGNSSRTRTDEPPRPPPPRGSGAGEDFYSSRRQLYEEDPLQRSRQSAEPRFISFQKEGSVGIRLTGGNEAGIFVTAVQPGSPASLQGLTPGDKILKVNDMDMHGVTREEAVLFLLSLQDRIDLIVQYCKEEYEEVVANQRGDSFHIKTHFHCDNPSKGEMAFKAGDVFRVIDTLHNGVVGSWQVLRIGRGHQEMQRGVIPNKSRAEELATAQFNATKKEMNASESRGNFFRRRRSTHRRSKSLSRENWDDVVFSDSISKFPAYERVVLRHPGFVRPVVLFGPVSDISREKLTKDFPDKFTAPLQDDDKTNSKCRIVRLSNIRDIMDRGKHALLDITPNAVDRLNYAQFYPIVIFLKTDSKHVIKQMRHGIPKSAHKSSKKLLEQCQKLERVWSHVFSTQIVLNDTESWYRKLREAIDLQQSGAVWMSETKPVESLSDDFLFPMTTSRLSYASSPESDLELSPGPSTSLSLGNLPQLVKSSSDPSIATNQDNLDRDRDIIGEGLPPPYTNPYEQPNPPQNRRQTMDTSLTNKYSYPAGVNASVNAESNGTPSNTRPQSLYGINAPDLPPRIDRHVKPSDIIGNTPPSRTNSSGGTIGRSAQERLFGKPTVSDDVQAEYVSRTTTNDSIDRTQQSSLDRQQRMNSVVASPLKPTQQNGSAYDSVSSYDSYNTTQLAGIQSVRLGPNAPDDLKSVPNANGGRPLPPGGMNPNGPEFRNAHDHHARNFIGANDLNRQNSPGRPQYHELSSARNIDPRNAVLNTPPRPSNLGLENSPRKQVLETKTDYGKYSRNNSASQADYSKIPKNPHGIVPPPNVNANGNGTPNGSGGPFKPVPPPKPKNYRPPMQGSGQWENGEPGSPRSPNGFFYPPTPSHYHHSQTPGSPHTSNSNGSGQHIYGTSGGGGSGGHYNGNSQQTSYVQSNGYNGNGHPYSGGGGQQYMHRSHPPPIANLPPHTPERHALDLAGSREQRGSAFELYRKPQIGAAGHHHNMSDMEPYDERYNNYYQVPQHPSRAVYPLDPANNAAAYHQLQQQQYYNMYPNSPPPPLPKVKKKSVLKSPLTAIKNALIKSTRPLRRMNSMVEPDKKGKPLRRQYSMMERGIGRLQYPDDYPTYPAGMHDQRIPYNGDRATSVPVRDHYYVREQQDMMNSTYQNLESEDIYGNIAPTQTRREEYDDMYSNRALIDLERRQAEMIAANRSGGRRIIRRHSTSVADRGLDPRRRPTQRMQSPEAYAREDIYQSRQGSYMLTEPRRPPSSEVMTRRRFYPDQMDISEDPIYQTRREVQRNQIYQSKKEMQERIAAGKKDIEREFSPPSSSQSERDDKSERDSIYQSRREVKESGLKTRSQLREQIYQTRREAMESMAEPIYVSKRDVVRPEPIYETKEECNILASGENETDEKKEEKTDVTVIANGNSGDSNGSSQEETLNNSKQSDLQLSADTVIEKTVIPVLAAASLAEPEDDVVSDEDEEEETQNEACVKPAEPPKPLLSPTAATRSPYHIANMRRTAASRTSLETQYTSQASLPIGPPNATSTPYASDMSLPMAGPVTAPTVSGGSASQRFPTVPREPTTTKGVFDHNGGTLADNFWNVSLQIPPGAIPPGVKQEIYFTVSDPRMGETVGGPPLDMENGETMLSPLVMCGPQGLEFLVPVTLNIPHCAGRTASLGLALKATDSEKNLHTEWDNIDLPSNAAAHTVSVKVDHF